MSKKENILELFSQLNNKTNFCKALSPIIKRDASYMYKHWFNGFNSITKNEEEQDIIIDFLQKTIANQNNVKSV